MYQTIDEVIVVAGVYKPGGFYPVKFQWRQRTYQIEKTTFITELKDGGVRQRMYSVLVKGTLYRLKFDRAAEQWWLQEVWCE